MGGNLMRTSLSRPTTGTSMCWMGTMRAASSPV
nr:MAG TPA: hypothetical protein [Caudoviricetes sp.]DAT04795.1 MAG TPA: hypothetical protein [Caudoviricetes sp.]DAV91272.1 MAG TPA: hypothetical protein [Caudoviricetes sp.]DAW39145.1 MAG TPA: hypothetical protein [Caudoviricetes sp.]DAY94380.1 MAG TPA: hypothetical protein [Caudoviricetes sp.]